LGPAKTGRHKRSNNEITNKNVFIFHLLLLISTTLICYTGFLYSCQVFFWFFYDRFNFASERFISCVIPGKQILRTMEESDTEILRKSKTIACSELQYLRDAEITGL